MNKRQARKTAYDILIVLADQEIDSPSDLTVDVTLEADMIKAIGKRFADFERGR